MPRYLVLKLEGPMQAWGTHTFEDFRPSNLFPTRSGLLGLLGACLGVERRDHAAHQTLAESVEFTIRVDRPGVKLPDFHTVLSARKVDGKENENPIVSQREYLFHASFTVVIGEKSNATIQLEAILEGLRRPFFTPFLGRRSCPLTRPLLQTKITEAADAKVLLATIQPVGGLIYAEDSLASAQPLRIRDVPIRGRHRQFASRVVYLHKEQPCS